MKTCFYIYIKTYKRFQHPWDKQRFIPATLLNVLEKWLGICYTYVSWNSAYSHMFKLTCGIRHGGVLSPYLFAAYIDDLIMLADWVNV